MKYKQFYFACVMTTCCWNMSLACEPLSAEKYAQTEERVRERYALVDSIELLTLVDVQYVAYEGFGDYKFERATFRVDLVFKGNAHPGDILVFEQKSTCSRSVRATLFDPYAHHKKSRPVEPSKRWLVYRNSAHQIGNKAVDPENAQYFNEIQSSDLTRPIDEALFDIKILNKIQAKISSTGK